MKLVFLFAGFQMVILLMIIACQVGESRYPEYEITEVVTRYGDAGDANSSGTPRR